MRPAAVLAIVLLAALAALVWCSAAASASETAVIRLEPGQNVVSWNGAEPYPIADFADTPVTQVHRWDAVGQEWLGRFVGQDGGTLPELHLLPRVQYVLVTETRYELTVPSPMAEIDPHAELRLAGPPDVPLRFEAYWPNEDSPLEDLIVLRPDDERLSVKVEVAGGIGEIEVYWLLDGRLNHQGLASDDVELLPGKHDDARLTAVDGSGQAVVVNLPRVVKLLPLDLPEMSYGIWTHIGVESAFTDAELETSIRYISDAGFDLIVFGAHHWASTGYAHPDDGKSDWAARSFERAVAATRAGEFALFSHIMTLPTWASQGDVTRHWRFYHVSPSVDLHLLQHYARELARQYPEIHYWMLSHESNLQGFWWTLDPILDVQRIRAAALGIWYENPAAVVVANGNQPTVSVKADIPVKCDSDWMDTWECAVDAQAYLQALYDHDFARWVDVVAFHPGSHNGPSAFEEAVAETNLTHQVMERNGHGETPMLVTSLLIPEVAPGYDGISSMQRADLMVDLLGWMTDDERIAGVILYKFRGRWQGAPSRLGSRRARIRQRSARPHAHLDRRRRVPPLAISRQVIQRRDLGSAPSSSKVNPARSAAERRAKPRKGAPRHQSGRSHSIRRMMKESTS